MQILDILPGPDLSRTALSFYHMLRTVSIVGRAAIHQKQFHSSRGVYKLLVEKVPALGESITEGSIASWSKAEGDRVAVDDVIVIVETDKVTVDIKSSHAGVFKKRLATDNVRLFLLSVSSPTNFTRIAFTAGYRWKSFV